MYINTHSNEKSNVEEAETANVGIKVPECDAAVLSYGRDLAQLV